MKKFIILFTIVLSFFYMEQVQSYNSSIDYPTYNLHYYARQNKTTGEYKIYKIRVPHNIIKLENDYISKWECFSYCNLIKLNILLTKYWYESIY